MTEEPSYTIKPSENGRAREVVLQIRQDQDFRAWNIARALKGRWALGLRAFYMTPARAKKWEALFAAGLDAAQVTAHDQRVWIFKRDGRSLTLAESMRLAETPEDDEPPAVAEIEVEF